MGQLYGLKMYRMAVLAERVCRVAGDNVGDIPNMGVPHVSRNRVLLSVFTAVAIVSMVSESATAQLFQGRLFGRRNANCCPAPAPAAPSCCGQTVAAVTPAPAAPCCGQSAAVAAPAPVVASAPVLTSAPVVASAPCCGGGVVTAPAPVSVAAPIVSNCCGGSSVVYGSSFPVQNAFPVQGTIIGAETLPLETGVVTGETILQGTSETVQASPSDTMVKEEMVESTTTSVVQPPVEADNVAPADQN